MVWVQGYFTAYNAIAPDINNVLGDQSYRWVLKKLQVLCRADENKYFNDAVVEMIKQLHPQGIKIGGPLNIQM